MYNWLVAVCDYSFAWLHPRGCIVNVNTNVKTDDDQGCNN